MVAAVLVLIEDVMAQTFLVLKSLIEGRSGDDQQAGFAGKKVAFISPL